MTNAVPNGQPTLALTEGVQTVGIYPSRDASAQNSLGTYLGQIVTFAGDAASYYTPAAGQTLSINQNQALFSLYSNTYGGNGSSNFQLPNLTGTVGVGTGQGPGLAAVTLGQTFGESGNTLSVPQLPSAVGGSSSPVDAHQASLGINYYINVKGTFPSEGGADLSSIGFITETANNFAPPGTLLCDGSVLNISQYSALYALIGPAYGGNGTTTFALPDLRGRDIVGAGALAGTTYTLGQKLGNDSYTISNANLPSGGDQSIADRQPGLVMNYLIATAGIYPQPGHGYQTNGTQPILGEIVADANFRDGGDPPAGWAVCNGQLLSVADNEALFELIGTTYGGDGVNTFGLPDLQGRTVVGADSSSDVLGQATGSATVTLTSNQLPIPATPAAPTLAHDTGTSSTDGLTNDPTITYPTPANGDTLIYSTNGTTYSSTAPVFKTDGTQDGLKTVYIKEENAAGGISASASNLTFTLDTIAPPLPSTPTIAGVADNGYTTNATPTVTGTAQVGATVALYRDNAVLLGSEVVGSNGQYSFTLTAPLSYGRHILYATATDAAGNRLHNTSSVSYVNIGMPPATPLTPTIADGTPINGVTSDNEPTISGMADAGDSVSVFRDAGVLIGTTTAGQNGSYSLAETTPLGDGRHILYALATDGAGNRSAPGVTYLTVQTAPVSPPSVPTLADGTPNGGTTGNATPTISGTADAGDSVSVLRDNGVLIGTTTAGQNGSYSIAETTPLANGSHILYALATDGAGNRSAPGITYLTVNTSLNSLVAAMATMTPQSSAAITPTAASQTTSTSSLAAPAHAA